MHNKILRFPIGAVVSAALLTLNVATSDARVSGMYASNFSFPLNGRTRQLSDLRGHVVVLDFWASWCGPCQRSLPEISRLHNTYGNDVQFLGLNDEDMAAIRATERRLGLSFPSVLDANDSIGNAYGVRSIPTTVVLDRYGRIVDTIVGFQPDGSLERAIEYARSIR